jgi:ABC-type transport system involved in multi-copper enzyme maturation permease subunit
MLEMMQAELMKASKKKRFWILTIVVALVVPLVQLIIAGFVQSRAGGTVLDQGDVVARAIQEVASPYSLTRNFLGGIVPTMLLIMAALIGSFLMGEDRSYKMWKTILVANPDRIKVLSAKFLSGMTIALFVMVAGVLGAVLFGLVGLLIGFSSSAAGDWGNIAGIFAVQWLSFAAPLALAFLLGWLLVSPLLGGVLVVLGPSILEGIILAVVSLSQVNRVTPLNAPLQQGRIQEVIETLQRFFFTPNINPASRLVGQALRDTFGGNLPSGGGNLSAFPALEWDKIAFSGGVAAVYAALFIGLLIWSFTTRDIQE